MARVGCLVAISSSQARLLAASDSQSPVNLKHSGYFSFLGRLRLPALKSPPRCDAVATVLAAPDQLVQIDSAEEGVLGPLSHQMPCCVSLSLSQRLVNLPLL